jgi:hypothetical protein
MQFRVATALIVFLGSYLPLALILLAQSFQFEKLDSDFCWPLRAELCEIPLTAPVFSILMAVLTLICFIITLISLKLIRPNQSIEIMSVKYIPADLMNYTLPYVVSFMSIDYQDTGKFVGFTVFLMWMFWIGYRSGQIILNPVLIAMSWRLYEVEYKFPGGQKVHIGQCLASGHLAAGTFDQATLQDIQIIKP